MSSISGEFRAEGHFLTICFRGSLNNYLIWRLVKMYMPYLSKSFREVVDLYRKFLTGAQKPLPRWEFCEETTELFFGHLIDSIYYQEQVWNKPKTFFR